jgi:hypothetical protein
MSKQDAQRQGRRITQVRHGELTGPTVKHGRPRGGLSAVPHQVRPPAFHHVHQECRSAS